MDTREAIANRIRQLCKERGITPNAISNISAVPQATVKSILNGESKNPGAVTLKKLCDGFEITLGELFSTPEFDELEQEIKKDWAAPFVWCCPIVFTDPGFSLSCGVQFALADDYGAAHGQSEVLPHVHPASWKYPVLLLPW